MKEENWEKEINRILEEQIEIILAMPFLNPPLDKFKIEEVRKGLEWQKNQILELFQSEKSKDSQKFIEILENLKIDENFIREIDLDGLHEDAWKLDKTYKYIIQNQNKKIQEIINQLKDEK
jgi:hypothetical protein